MVIQSRHQKTGINVYDAWPMIEHQLLTISGSGGYPLTCRYWQTEEPTALVIMVHGVVSHSLWLESIATGLAELGISCVVPDRRGAGLNKQARGDAPHAQALLDDLENIYHWAQATSLPIHLCGFCWGANYVVNLMAEKSPVVESLALLAPSLFPSKRITEQPFVVGDSGLASELPVMPLECFTDGPAFHDFIQPDPLRVKQVSPRLNNVMAEFSQGIWIKFLRITLPTLVILGNDDEVVDNQATQRLFNRLANPCKQLHVLPGKHGIQFDAAERVIAALSRWIQETHNGSTPGQAEN